MLLIAFGFASFGMGITSYMKTFQQMDWINFIMLPMFLLSATFYPITVYPQSIQWVIIRRCRCGTAWSSCAVSRPAPCTLGLLWHVLYFAVMIALGLILTTRRLRAALPRLSAKRRRAVTRCRNPRRSAASSHHSAARGASGVSSRSR